ncbi:hypothetical protein [Chitinophaga sp. MM2321]|uniref:hypothetical protein n=1 Tax=Chitinophaga sp. MM2321 TaxID=3137178 RepID=UPI0032D59979
MKKILLLISCISIIGSQIVFSQSAEKAAPGVGKIKTSPPVARPLFKDFMGINGHYTFKPELYNQVCRLVRNYHNIDWDVKKLGAPVTIPESANHVNWKEDVYGPWKKAGFETDICIQFGAFGTNSPSYEAAWAGQERWTYNYGKAMAAYYGPSGRHKLATSFEIDNEPGTRFNPALFRTVFKQMAQGIRDGDPAAKILTPTAQARNGDDYSQDLRGMYAEKDILPLYDVINVHTYSTMDKTEATQNNWHRSYPEDTSIAYLKVIDETVEWRNKNATDKEIWVTEFGYDACTPEAMKYRKDWALKLNWQGATDLQQAQYLVRSFLVFAERDISRAYLYYYDDNDEASFHAASGLTREFKPKMSFWAVKQLYKTLGDYRFKRVVKKDIGDLFVYEFEHDTDPTRVIWMAWSPTGAKTFEKDTYVAREIKTTLKDLPGTPTEVAGMATADGKAPQAAWKKAGKSAITLTVSERPTYIIMKK